MAEWIFESSLPVGISIPRFVVSADNRIYLLEINYGNYSFNIYNIDSKQWNKSASIQSTYAGNASYIVYHNRVIYVFGDYSWNGSIQRYYVWKYNIDTNNWSQYKSNYGYYAQGGYAIYGESIYGFNCQDSGGTTPYILVYDTISESTTRISTNYPVKDNTSNWTWYAQGAVTVGNIAYVVGGIVPGVATNVSSYAYTYDYINNSWNSIQQAPRDLGRFPFCYLINNKLFASSYENYATSIYDINLNTWSESILPPSPNDGIYAFAYNDSTLYAFNRGYGLYSYSLKEAPTLTIGNIVPAGGFVNEQEDSRFSWVFTSSDGAQQASANIQWQNVATGSTTTVLVQGPDTYRDFPANTFPNGQVRWRIKVNATNGYETDWTDWVTFSTIDAIPLIPTNLNPSAGSHNSSEIIQFSWRHNSPYGTPQGGYEIQITYDNMASWATLSTAQTPSQSYNVPADTLKPTNVTGSVGWRVRTQNTDLAWSQFSNPVFFIAVTAPDAPQWVSVTNTNFPVANWISPVQVAYHLTIKQGNNLIYDSKELWGSDKSYKVKEIINDGQYVFSLRIANINGVWSEWSNYNAVISTTKPYNLVLSGNVQNDAANLDWEVNYK